MAAAVNHWFWCERSWERIYFTSFTSSLPSLKSTMFRSVAIFLHLCRRFRGKMSLWCPKVPCFLAVPKNLQYFCHANSKTDSNMKAKMYVCLALSLCLAACSTVSMTGRKQLNLVSESEILSASLTEYQSYMKTAKIATDATATAVVKNVAQRIAAAAEAYLKTAGQEADIANYAWEFNLVNDSQLNAFCMPGGKIVVYTGMLNLIGNGSDRDDMLAAVIGHEVGHAIAKHGNERASQQMLANLGGSLLGAAVSQKSEATQQAVAMAYGMGTQYGALLPFSRKQELEADYIGVVLAILAGYEANAAITLWEKMSAASTSTTAEFMSTHPSSTTRINALKESIPQVKAQLGVK